MDNYKIELYTLALLGAFMVAAILAFNVWLDHECNPSGIITTHGRVCFEDLSK